MSFSTGTNPEGAVPFNDPNAVCGSTQPGEYIPSNPTNAANFFLPRQGNCPQPISSVWVANITRWMMCVLDYGQQVIGSPRSCQPACLLRDAIRYIGRRHTVECLSVLTAQGETPAAGYPRMWIDDSVSPACLMFWDCGNNTYQRLCPTPGVGGVAVGGVAVGGVAVGG